MSSTVAAPEPFLESGRTVPAQEVSWNPLTRVAFRFFFCYFALYCFPFPFVFIDDGSEPFAAVWHRVIPWLWARLLHTAIRPPAGVGGDSPYDWALCVTLLVLSAVATLLWSAVDQKNVRYSRLHAFIRLYVALYLGVQMLSYGMAKIFPAQFAAMSLPQLSTRIGDLPSRQALLWMFIGESRVYQVFAGAAEVLAGVLLSFPRLMTIGALLAAAAMANVFALNVGYNVVVKLFSFHMIAMALFVAAPDIPVILRALVLRRVTAPSAPPRLLQPAWLYRALLALIWIYGLGVTAHFVRNAIPRSNADWTKASAVVPFYGVWNVEEFALDGASRPPLTTDQLRWRQVIFDFAYSYYCCNTQPAFPGFTVTPMNSAQRSIYWMKFDRASNQLHLRPWKFGQSAPSFDGASEFTVQSVTPDRLVLDGAMDGHRIHALLLRAADFPLRKSLFRWIQTH